MYPVSYEADYAAEGRNRLTTFFRSIVAIPWLIVAYVYGLVASIAVFVAWFAMIFTGRYPDGLYSFNAGYLRMQNRVNGFHYLLTDEYPPFGGDDAPGLFRGSGAPSIDDLWRGEVVSVGAVGVDLRVDLAPVPGAAPARATIAATATTSADRGAI